MESPGFFHLIFGETLAPTTQISIADTIIRTAIFLAMLALGGYFFVIFHRNGYFGHGKIHGNTSSPSKPNGDEIRIIATRMLGNRKCLTVVEYLDKRFLIAMANDRVEKLSEWDVKSPE
jgi:flagellar biogenesis protein FliO